MKKLVLAAFFGLMALAGCQESGKVEKMENAKKLPEPAQYLDKVSYGIGQSFGKQMRLDTSVKINMDYFIKGYLEGLDSNVTVNQDSITSAMQKFQTDGMTRQRKMQEQFQKDMQAKGEKFKDDGPKFYKSFLAKGGVIQTPSGLAYKVIKKGSGPIPNDTNFVRIHVIGKLSDGTEFDNSYTRKQPLELQVMGLMGFRGLNEAIKLMPVGSIYEFCIPDSLAFSSQGNGKIPPNAYLDMQVELVAIIPAPPRQPGMMGGPGGPGMQPQMPRR